MNRTSNDASRFARLTHRTALAVSAATALCIGIGIASFASAQDAETSPGKAAYLQNCAACHGANLTDGQFAPALKGASFLNHWTGANADKLDQYIRSSMPPANAGKLDDGTYAGIVSFILESNGAAPAGRALASIAMPKPVVSAGGDSIGGLSTRHPIAPWPKPADTIANFKPVTEAELDNPAPEDWPAWRRSHLGQGYSPLKQITAANVKQLKMVWSAALPGGEATTEPLVRNGILYMMGYGDAVFAFDAATGRQLWRYQRTLPKGVNANGKKTIALYGDKLYAATSDLHLVALEAKTGRPVWDKVVTDRTGLRSLGGPLAAKGVIMLGLTGQAPTGALIAAFDSESGEKLWSFNTIAQPGTPNGDTWNGLTAEQRSGASVWTSGSFDPVTGLALWGTAQTYDTGPLRDRKPGLNNDGLYTDSTLAFEPRTGKLVWYYQHIQNDQFDLDWVFDRVIGTLNVKGKPQRVVMTAGKAGLFDSLDAATGKYVSTVDMGVQNFITAVDPVTGVKTVNPDLIPDRTKVRYVCPHGGGGRNWQPTSFDEASATTFVNARDVCTDIVPTQGKGFLTTGVNIEYAPPPNSDGNYGIIRALDMQKGTIKWTARQRTPYTMGMLATAGGLLFSGSVDRQFTAYDQATGKLLWTQQMSGIPNASAITYSVGGKQYVAMITGYGNPVSLGISVLTPEVQMPSVVSSEVYVFALPD
ncbi:MAG: PQQ-binding-like beta-propeller repeat protein [Sphingobium sp.]|nr:PQQ-binding-like beta-propeller repeat protein [Sphingobium sp.]